MNQPRGRPGLLSWCCVALVLSGCAGGDGGDGGDRPSTLPPATAGPQLTATPAPTTTPTPDPPTPVPAATQFDAEGVEAFVRYAVDVFNYAYATGDTAPLEEIAAEDCGICSSVTGDIRTTYDAGGHIEGSQLTVEQVFPVDPRGNVAPAAAADISLSETIFYDADGSIEDEFAAGSGQYIFELERQGERWLLGNVRKQSSPESESPS